MPNTSALSHEILHAALAGLEARSAKLDDQIAQVHSLLGTQPKRLGRPPKNAATSEGDGVLTTPFSKRRTFSAATRKKMAAAQKARWARLKGPDQEPAPKKRTMSAEGRKRIAEAARKRWAAVRKAKTAAATTKPANGIGRSVKKAAPILKKVAKKAARKTRKKTAQAPVASAPTSGGE